MTNAKSIRILGVSGSHRSGGFNLGLLGAAAELAPEGASITPYDYRDIPLYDPDAEEPESVGRLKSAIADADAVLIATPEYNFSIPGVLKNALDWVSRPAAACPLKGKPVAVVSASAGFVGGARGQQHVKVILLALGSEVFPFPELLVGSAAERFEDGRLTDPKTREFLGRFVGAFVDWTRTRVRA